MAHCQPSCFPVTFPGKFCTPPQDLVHHQLNSFSGKLFERLRRLLQTLFLPVFHCKLDIRYLECPYKALHHPSTNPYALDNHACQNEWCCSAKQYATMIQQRNSKHIIFVKYIDFLVSDCHSSFALVPSACFLQLFLCSL